MTYSVIAYSTANLILNDIYSISCIVSISHIYIIPCIVSIPCMYSKYDNFMFLLYCSNEVLLPKVLCVDILTINPSNVALYKLVFQR